MKITLKSLLSRITKLRPNTQTHYREIYKFDKSESCSYFVYRNGVCSDKSFIIYSIGNGEGGFLSYNYTIKR